MRKIKIAQIGTSFNSHGNDIFNSLRRQTDIFEIVGYHFPENEREKFPDRMCAFEEYKELTLEEILNNPEIDAVTVETEEIYLTKHAQMVADAKKHMHMEKPGSPSLPAFEKLIDTVKKNKTVFHTGYMYRYNPYIMELKEQIKNGELGEISSVEAQMNCSHPEKVRNWLEAFPGGMMFFLGCHLIDLIYGIQGMPKNVIALNKCSGLDGVKADDIGMAVFEYENGVSFAKTSAVELGGFERRQLVVTGSKKTVEIKPLEWWEGSNITTTKRTATDPLWRGVGEVETTPAFNRYDTMMQSFAAMVRGEKENPWSYDYELELYKIIQKACGCK